MKATASATTAHDAGGRDAEWTAIRRLSFSNMTRPVLDEMLRTPDTWRALLDVTRDAADRRERIAIGTERTATTDRATVVFRLGAGRPVRVHLRMKAGEMPNGNTGTDELASRRLVLARTDLPEAVLIACGGRRVRDVVDPERVGGIAADAVIRKATQVGWGLALHLRLKFVQPTDADLDAIRNACRPGASR